MLDYNYFKKHYKIIATNLSKQQALDADPRAIQQIFLLRNWGGTTMFFIIEEAKKIILDLLQWIVTVLWIYFALTQCSSKMTKYNM